MIAALIVAALMVATAFSFIHAHAKRVMHREHALANLRTLREYKHIALHYPHHIVDYRHRNHVRKENP
ncbi:MAG: hypothetical protein MUP76_04620 [Acidimicrobiia bacterium]|nr:hypothetical protein [Acidimicrobiia bacterium]